MVEGAHLVIAANHLRGDDGYNLVLGEVVLQTLHDCDGGILRIAHATEELKDWVVEAAEASEIGVELGRAALERLEERYRRQRVSRRGNLVEQSPARIEGEEVIQRGDKQQPGEEQEESDCHTGGSKRVGTRHPVPL